MRFFAAPLERNACPSTDLPAHQKDNRRKKERNLDREAYSTLVLRNSDEQEKGARRGTERGEDEQWRLKR